MFLYLKLAIRNLLRNKRRTFIAGSAIGIGLAALICTDALILGMEENMIASATESFLGEGQIHRRGFRESYEVDKTIVDPQGILERLRNDKLVDRAAPRVITYAMINSPANLAAVSMIGIDPEAERYLSQVDEALVEGEYFAGDDPHDIVIGQKLADILEVHLGSRVVMTAAQARSGDLSQEMYRISGIFHFNIKEMDRATVFVRLSQARKMLGLGDDIHEIALTLHDREPGLNSDDPFWGRYSDDENEAISWSGLLPELKTALELSQFSTFIIGLILFGVVALGIINTLFMSMHERQFEFGVLRAIGTRPFIMARLILFEAGALAALSIIMGNITGLIVTYITSKTGIDYTGIEFSGVTFRELLYPILEVKQFIVYPLAVFIFTILIGLYPAFSAARLSPVKAMRRSL